MKRLAFVVLVGFGLGAPNVIGERQSSPPKAKIDVSKLGPQVGERVPDFSLADQNGIRQTLQSIMGPKGAMLVFVRSADWCPYCKTQLVELQSRVQELKGKGIGLATISYDPPETLVAFSKQHGITFPMLSDVGSATIKRYGILNTVAMESAGPNAKDPALADDIKTYVAVTGGTARMVGIAFPGTFMLDHDGRVTSRFFEDAYAERSTVSSILVRTGVDMPLAGTKISTPHLEVTSYASDSAVAPGNRVTLILEVAPHPGIHVYAPGASGYRVITPVIDAADSVSVLPIAYPPSEIYTFKPLNERVPVYQKPFMLRQEFVLKATPQAQASLRGKETLTLTGTLQYQACDDSTCFNPLSIPLSWTFSLRPIVFERTVPRQ
jgi:peroxiredoxin